MTKLKKQKLAVYVTMFSMGVTGIGIFIDSIFFSKLVYVNVIIALISMIYVFYLEKKGS